MTFSLHRRSAALFGSWTIFARRCLASQSDGSFYLLVSNMALKWAVSLGGV